jgi:hypothetical protein|tara:strand:+ start:1315 stop:1683 length:369 start_codon:yes stop_codon:yes gene_type:complete
VRQPVRHLDRSSRNILSQLILQIPNAALPNGFHFRVKSTTCTFTLQHTEFGDVVLADIGFKDTNGATQTATLQALMTGFIMDPLSHIDLIRMNDLRLMMKSKQPMPSNMREEAKIAPRIDLD